MDDYKTMLEIELPVEDMLGPKPCIDTPKLLAQQIGTLTADDLRKFNWHFEDEHFIQACITGEKGSEIQNSRLVALIKIHRNSIRLKYPNNVDPLGHLVGGLGDDTGAAFQAELETKRLLRKKLQFDNA